MEGEPQPNEEAPQQENSEAGKKLIDVGISPSQIEQIKIPGTAVAPTEIPAEDPPPLPQEKEQASIEQEPPPLPEQAKAVQELSPEEKAEKAENAKNELMSWTKKLEGIEVMNDHEKERKLINHPKLPEVFKTATGRELKPEVRTVAEASVKEEKVKDFLAEEHKEEKMNARIGKAIEKRSDSILEQKRGEKTPEDFKTVIDNKMKELFEAGISIEKSIFCELMNQGYKMEDAQIKKGVFRGVKGISVVKTSLDGVPQKNEKPVFIDLKKISEILLQAVTDLTTEGGRLAEVELQAIVNKGKERWKQEKHEAIKQVVRTEVTKITTERQQTIETEKLRVEAQQKEKEAIAQAKAEKSAKRKKKMTRNPAMPAKKKLATSKSVRKKVKA
ncbi:MAG: hypothetical protein A2528_03510 [Candidatus Staskawiczbacteria bacterium RIFOXYD2_FULL_37_9]|uniref:Uncharacterized protein n=1 Tax=Candidatus Staskawiczbacteria bacterium RIFOXYB1_FULL_37_44 TaxID=1802223 RepID=A0A1G2IU51_9BACT|nr:MAG: hypothetical protein A2358_02270 [Candidatus Staskawiczbacteria bacterium RIFOXYB1_FULL_37_44]OGZ82813.1 MAG: hypothetical protein A2416_03250 [Candidatus Staskawiczbacteria bacterium RIFOXYC1_FULL_37_52]OGZ89761.1 MAG: hypothetical protein A2444_01250 [Candidatus Staskawiczbacteria bacterium RIFOXYC2_FULL_37_19]OGZ90584.1 MAG: hypothetical protein A2581_02710 [Candidatus Staskawiczbacteria bacterium RIFOXYD1_FULL_37_110]OGZ93179.1 MAG: hypothetical protein A2528_03510 [Candidatus Stask